MFLTVLQYLLAVPFAGLWAICLIGNTWMFCAVIAGRYRRDELPEPVPAIGLLAGLVAIALAPIPHLHPWWKVLTIVLLPEAIGILLAILTRLVARRPSHP